MIKEITEVLENCIIKNLSSGYYKASTLPSINISAGSEYKLVDVKGETLKMKLVFSDGFGELRINYFKENASKRIANCVEFIIENGVVVEIKEYWDEKIIEDFNNSLPKSKRGKIKPWYDNEEVWEEYLQKQAKNDSIS